MNSFNKTELYDYLIKEKNDTIIITGYAAEYCVLTTYRGAQDKDLTPIILKKAIASGKKEYINFVEDMCDIIKFFVPTLVVAPCHPWHGKFTPKPHRKAFPQKLL
jgi:nicotinamidase-related amidase